MVFLSLSIRYSLRSRTHAIVTLFFSSIRQSQSVNRVSRPPALLVQAFFAWLGQFRTLRVSFHFDRVHNHEKIFNSYKRSARGNSNKCCAIN